jgi:septal ring factor EnvC (AmiA/AmiB activator)
MSNVFNETPRVDADQSREARLAELEAQAEATEAEIRELSRIEKDLRERLRIQEDLIQRLTEELEEREEALRRLRCGLVNMIKRHVAWASGFGSLM